MSAHNGLSSALQSFHMNSNTKKQQSSINMQTEYQKSMAMISIYKNMASSAGVDGSACVGTHSDDIAHLHSVHTQNLNQCVGAAGSEGTQIIDDAKYVIDIAINNLESLQFQLDQCNKQLTCILPLVTEIEMQEVKLGESIRTNVGSAQSLLATLNTTVDKCSQDYAATYISEASTRVEEIKDCIDSIIS